MSVVYRTNFHLTTGEYPEPPFGSQIVSDDRLSSTIRHAQQAVYDRVLPKLQHMARRVGAEESNSRGCGSAALHLLS